MSAEANYSCGLDGQCEKHSKGDYDSLEQCQSSCTAAENKDLIYLILSYNPGSSRSLPPSGQIRLVKEILGVKVSARKAEEILLLFRVGRWNDMRQEQLLTAYFHRQYTLLQLFTRDLISLIDNRDLMADYDAIEREVLMILQDYCNKSSDYDAEDDAEDTDLELELNYDLMDLLLKGDNDYHDDDSESLRYRIDELIADGHVFTIVTDESSLR